MQREREWIPTQEAVFGDRSSIAPRYIFTFDHGLSIARGGKRKRLCASIDVDSGSLCVLDSSRFRWIIQPVDSAKSAESFTGPQALALDDSAPPQALSAIHFEARSPIRMLPLHFEKRSAAQF
jgi:hypothetical protein